jgi:hypothetical protein
MRTSTFTTLTGLLTLAAVGAAAALVGCSEDGSTPAPTTTAPGPAERPTMSAPSAETDAPGTDAVPAAAEPAGAVTGTIRGTPVSLASAEFTGDLAVFEGDGWGWNPSLLIFLFADDDAPPAGKTITVDAGDGMQQGTPHVHYRWRDPDTGEVETEIVMSGYDLRLEFGAIEDGHLTGTLSFSIPDQETEVSGRFRAKVE